MKWKPVVFSQHRFDEADYLRVHREKFKSFADTLQKSVQCKILDIGAGVGTVYSFLPSLDGIEIHALEIIPEFVQTLCERGIHGQVFDLDKGQPFPFPSDHFDYVLCDSILEHTLKPSYLISESHRVLKKDGILIIAVPNAISVRRRWNHLRGRNIFYPLIDNLFSRSYLQRCAIFYSQTELKKYVGSMFQRCFFRFIDEPEHDAHTLATKMLRLLSRVIPEMRDVVIMSATK